MNRPNPRPGRTVEPLLWSFAHILHNLDAYGLTTDYTCRCLPQAPTGFCWICKQGRESLDLRFWAATRSFGWICFTLSSCKELQWVPSLHPLFSYSSRFSAIGSGLWDFLAAICLAPFQWALWPVLSPLHLHACNGYTNTQQEDVFKGNYTWQVVSSGHNRANWRNLVPADAKELLHFLGFTVLFNFIQIF